MYSILGERKQDHNSDMLGGGDYVSFDKLRVIRDISTTRKGKERSHAHGQRGLPSRAHAQRVPLGPMKLQPTPPEPRRQRGRGCQSRSSAWRAALRSFAPRSEQDRPFGTCVGRNPKATARTAESGRLTCVACEWGTHAGIPAQICIPKPALFRSMTEQRPTAGRECPSGPPVTPVRASQRALPAGD